MSAGQRWQAFVLDRWILKAKFFMDKKIYTWREVMVQETEERAWQHSV